MTLPNLTFPNLALRWWCLLSFVVCAGLIGTALYFQYVMYLDPCPLCIFQRIVVMVLGVICLFAFLHNPGGAGRRIYGALLVGVSLAGMGLAGWHVRLQNLPPDRVPECGPGPDYLFDTLPWIDAVRKVLDGSGECAQVNWVFLGLTIPAWTLVFFVVTLLFGVYVFRSRPRLPIF